MYLKHCTAVWLGGAALAVPVFALAGETASGQHASEAPRMAPPDAQVVRPVASAGAGFAAAGAATAKPAPGAAASPGELDGMRGAGAQSADATSSATLTGNAATRVATGSNVIQSGSFANAAGLPVVIQNSGANVLIQNATVINLELK